MPHQFSMDPFKSWSTSSSKVFVRNLDLRFIIIWYIRSTLIHCWTSAPIHRSLLICPYYQHDNAKMVQYRDFRYQNAELKEIQCSWEIWKRHQKWLFRLKCKQMRSAAATNDFRDLNVTKLFESMKRWFSWHMLTRDKQENPLIRIKHEHSKIPHSCQFWTKKDDGVKKDT